MAVCEGGVGEGAASEDVVSEGCGEAWEGVVADGEGDFCPLVVPELQPAADPEMANAMAATTAVPLQNSAEEL